MQNKEREITIKKAKVLADKLRQECANKDTTPEKYVLAKIQAGGMKAEEVKAFADILNAPNTNASMIIPTMSRFLVKQELAEQMIDYNAYLPIPINFETVENGVIEFIYRGNLPAGSKSGFEDVVIGDYNPPLIDPTVEIYEAKMQVSKSVKLLDGILNDVTKDVALFYAIAKDVAWYVAQAIAKAFFKLGWQMIADPLSNEFNNVKIPDTFDVSKLTPDITMKGTLSEIFEQLNVLSDRLATVNRKGIIPARFIPTGFPIDKSDFEYNPARGERVCIMPTEFVRQYQINLQATTFNLGKVEINFTPKALAYTQTFEDYGGVTGLEHDRAKGIYDLIIMQNGGIIGFSHYSASKNVETPNLYDVYTEYNRIGVAYKKTYLYLKIRVEVTAPPTPALKEDTVA